MSLLLSCSTGKSSVQSHPGDVTLLMDLGCDCTNEEDFIRSVQCDSGEKHTHIFSYKVKCFTELCFSFSVGSSRSCWGDGSRWRELFSLIIGVLNVLQNSGVESCNLNSWEKVQTCILSFQKMPTWISLIEVEQPQGKFSGQTISNSKQKCNRKLK